MKPKPLAWITAALTFAIALALFARTLAPGLLLSDSAEFQTLVYTLGMTHPTGYPVYLLFGRLFTLLPLGDPAWRVSLFSAFLGALAAGLLAYNLQRISANPVASLAVGLAVAVAPLFWWQAVIAELYTASALMLLVVISLLLEWQRSRRAPLLALAGLAGGLSLGIHNTVALLAPATLLFLLVYRASRRDWALATLGAAAGLLLTLAAFWAIDLNDPPSSYFHTTFFHGISAWNIAPEQSQRFFERVKFLVAAPQFRALMFADPSRQTEAGWQVYREALQANTSPVFLFLAAAGATAGFFHRATRPAALLAAVGWACLTGFILNYQIGDINVFYVPTYALAGLAAGLSAALLNEGLRRLARLLTPRAWLAVVLQLALGLGLAAGLLYPHYGRVSASWQAGRITFLREMGYASQSPYPVDDPTLPYERAVLLVNYLPDDALVFTNWEWLFAYLYVAHVEQGRTTMDFYEVWPQTWGVTELSTLDFIDAALGTRPIYLDFQPDPRIRSRFEIKPVFLFPGVYEITGRKP